MSLYDDDTDERVAPPTQLPSTLIECEHRLLYKIEQHAIALFQAAMDEENVTVTFNRDGMLEVSTALFQLLSLHKSRKNVS